MAACIEPKYRKEKQCKAANEELLKIQIERCHTVSQWVDRNFSGKTLTKRNTWKEKRGVSRPSVELCDAESLSTLIGNIQ